MEGASDSKLRASNIFPFILVDSKTCPALACDTAQTTDPDLEPRREAPPAIGAKRRSTLDPACELAILDKSRVKLPLRSMYVDRCYRFQCMFKLRKLWSLGFSI